MTDDLISRLKESVMTNRIPVDQREEIEYDEKPATKGTVKPNQLAKNAQTFVDEAERQLRNAIRYYETAAEWYTKANNTIVAETYRLKANAIREILQN